MGSVSEKLTYLAGTKSAIKDAIVAKGVSVADTDTFRSYATKIASISGGGDDDEHVYTGHVDAVGLRAIGWTESDITYLQEDVWWDEEDDDYWKVSDANIALYTNATKVTIDGVEMADVSNLNTFRNSGVCVYLPKVDFYNKDFTFYNCCWELCAIPSIDISRATEIWRCFEDHYNIRSINTSSWNTSKFTSIVFQGLSNVRRLDVGGFDTSNMTSMSYMFRNCYSLRSLDLSGFNTSNVTNMSSMFDNCISLKSLDLSGFNTSNVTNMSSMFNGCISLKSLDLSGFNTSNVTNMSLMFSSCYSLRSLDLSGFDTSNVTNMSLMFNVCYSLRSLDLSGFDTSNVTTFKNTFSGCYLMSDVKCSDVFSLGASQSNFEIIGRLFTFSSVKSLLSGINNGTLPTFASPVIKFNLGVATVARIKDDLDGTLQSIIDNLTTQGWTITGLTII